MATRIRYHQLTMCPTNGDNDELSTVTIPHVQEGWVQVVSAEFIGGGSEKRFLLHCVTFEPVPEQDEAAEEPTDAQAQSKTD